MNPVSSRFSVEFSRIFMKWFTINEFILETPERFTRNSGYLRIEIFILRAAWVPRKQLNEKRKIWQNIGSFRKRLFE